MANYNLPTEFEFVVSIILNKKEYYIEFIKSNKLMKNGTRMFQKHLVRLTSDVTKACVAKSRVKARKLINEAHFVDGFVDKSKLTIERYREPEYQVNIVMPRNYKEEWAKLKHEVMLKVGGSWAKEKMFFNQFGEAEKQDLINISKVIGVNEVKVIPIKPLKKLEVTLHNL
jgi:hypothetical protein